MAYLRSGGTTAAGNNSNGEAAAVAEKKSENIGTRPGKMTLVIFVGLLIDLLAFTLILPLFPALLDHYRDAFTILSSDPSYVIEMAPERQKTDKSVLKSGQISGKCVAQEERRQRGALPSVGRQGQGVRVVPGVPGAVQLGALRRPHRVPLQLPPVRRVALDRRNE